MIGKARAAVRCLRAGVVPSWLLERLSVAYDEVKESVDHALEQLLARHQAGPLFVLGEWGVGKTHLLSYIRASARALGVPCVLVSLDGHSLSLNYPQRIYAKVADGITVERLVGLRQVFAQLLFGDAPNASLRAYANSGESGQLCYPIAALCEASKRGEVALDDEQYAWSVLLGLDIKWSISAYKRRAALARLVALVKMFRAIDLGGMVILFDETETIDQLWNIRSRLTAYTTIGSLCQLSGLWCVFGITDRFKRTVAGDIERVEGTNYDLDPNAERFLQNWKKHSYRVIEPPTIEHEYASEIASRVAQLYRDAHACDPGLDILNGVVIDWLKNPIRNPRRLIRSVVDRLDRSRALTLPMPQA